MRVEERRAAHRLDEIERHGVQSVHVRPGHHADVVNISTGGVLIDTAHRVLPGSTVELVLQRHQYRASVRGRVVRAAVARVQPGRVCYRSAIRFDRSLPWFIEESAVHPLA
jgi:hypothetical protein